MVTVPDNRVKSLNAVADHCLVSIAVRANCGCGWRAGGSDAHNVLEQAKAHAIPQMRPTLVEAGHAVEMFVLIRPVML